MSDASIPARSFLDPMIIYVNLFLFYELFTLFRCGIVESKESLVNSNF